MSSHPATFHHKGISRLQAEELLLAAGKDGGFLVRDSETIPGAYTLCLLYQGRVHQYRILPDKDGKIYVQAEKGVQQRKFVDLQQLVHEYIHRGDKNGLVSAMLYPVSATTEDDRDSDEEEDMKDRLLRNRGSTEQTNMTEQEHDMSEKSDVESFITRYFQQRFSQMDMSNQDGEFLGLLSTYVTDGLVKDGSSVTSGGENMCQLRHLLGAASKDLDRQLDLYLSKIDVCRQLFGPMTTSPLVKKRVSFSEKKDNIQNVSTLSDKLAQCRTALQHLEKKAMKKIQDLTSASERDLDITPPTQILREGSSNVPNIPARRTHSVKPVIPPTVFEAKVVKHGQAKGKINLTVDIQAGKLFAVKPSKEILDDSNVFTHDKIAQLIKNTKNNCRLDVRVDGRHKKETYAFNDVRERENFCQLVQQLKNMHSIHQEVDNISLFVGTWNMGDENPPWNIGQWLKSQGVGKTREKTLSLIPHDMYVIGSQESSLSDKDWANRLKTALFGAFSQDYHIVAATSLWSIRIVVLVKVEYKNKITHVQQSSVKTGIANALGNKGAIGVSFYFNGTSLCFINTHLTSGHERLTRRNQNFRDIIKGLHLGPKNLSVFDTTNQFQHLFFLGDLNYRLVNIEPMEIIRLVTQDKNYSRLLNYDQLLDAQGKKEAFFGFSEEEITFPPTYRLEKGKSSLNYEWQKFKKTGTRINAPSWCDRVLWRSYPETYIRNTSYGCVLDICSSDHRPVFSSFDLGICSQFVSAPGHSAKSGDTKIVFQEIYAEVKTMSKEIFIVEFHSPCFDGPQCSQKNVMYHQARDGYCVPKWSARELPKLEPLFDDRDYLDDQHILIAIKSADGMESYGECVLALRSMFGIKPQPFEISLCHLGEETGIIRGLMHVNLKEGTGIPSSRVRRARRSYELVYMDTEFLAQDPEIDGASPSGVLACPSPSGLSGAHGTGRSMRTATKEQVRLRRQSSSSRSPSPSSALSPEKRRSLAEPQALLKQPAVRTKACSVSDNLHAAHTSATEESSQETRVVLRQSQGDKPTLSPKRGQHLRPGQTCERSAVDGLLKPGVSGVDENSNQEVARLGSVKRQASFFEASGEASTKEERVYDEPYNESDDSDKEPPLPPPRTTSHETSADGGYAQLRTHYDRLQKPKSVNEWLLDLGLPQYISDFFQNGWDDVSFIGDLSHADLSTMNIDNEEHTERILRSIKDMMK